MLKCLKADKYKGSKHQNAPMMYVLKKTINRLCNPCQNIFKHCSTPAELITTKDSEEGAPHWELP